MTTLIINDDNYLEHMPDAAGLVTIDGDRYSFGMVPRDYSRTAYGETEFATAGRIKKIPREQWPDLIADKNRDKSSLKHVWEDDLGRKILDQDGIPYCHAFSPAIAIMLVRAANGYPDLEISAGSIGGPVTNYRKRGAWIGDDLKQIVRQGAATTEYVPMRQVSRSGWKPGADENCELHKVEEWDELRPRDLDELISALLINLPVCIGLNWWGHAVTSIDVVDTGRGSATSLSRYDIGNLNSWGQNYGDGGYFILSGNKRIPDEQYAPRVTRPSVE